MTPRRDNRVTTFAPRHRSYVFTFIYGMSTIGPHQCVCTSFKPLFIIYGLVAVWASAAGFVGTIVVARGFECMTEAPRLYVE